MGPTPAPRTQFGDRHRPIRKEITDDRSLDDERLRTQPLGERAVAQPLTRRMVRRNGRSACRQKARGPSRRVEALGTCAHPEPTAGRRPRSHPSRHAGICAPATRPARARRAGAASNRRSARLLDRALPGWEHRRRQCQRVPSHAGARRPATAPRTEAVEQLDLEARSTATTASELRDQNSRRMRFGTPVSGKDRS